MKAVIKVSGKDLGKMLDIFNAQREKEKTSEPGVFEMRPYTTGIYSSAEPEKEDDFRGRVLDSVNEQISRAAVHRALMEHDGINQYHLKKFKVDVKFVP